MTLGNFDGLHRGHQALLATTKRIAADLRTQPAAISFSPHPDVFFKKIISEDLPLLTPTQKLRAFAELGISALYILEFDTQLAGLAAGAFFDNILKNWLQTRAVVIGHDFRFGARRQGDDAFLRDACARAKMELHVQAVVEHGTRPASSTLVRELLVNSGDVTALRELLGRPYLLEGQLTPGQQLGRRIGFPTLNIKDIRQLLPRIGVYCGWVYLPTSDEQTPVMHLPTTALPAVFNIGKRPTVSTDADKIHVEAHLLGELPPTKAEITRVGLYLGYRLRDEKKFSDINALKQQIAADITQAKTLLNNQN